MRNATKAGIAAALLGLSVASQAATRYVTDELLINLRSGAGNEYRIIQRLRTGSAVEVLESEDGWTRVRAADGETGWVPAQYLMSRPAAADRLAEATERFESVSGDNERLLQTLEEMRSELEQARRQVSDLTATRSEFSQKLDRAQRGLELAQENEGLKKQVIDLKRRVQDLNNETERLADSSRRDWFFAGASVLFAGMLIGIAATRIRWRRRSSWSEL